MTLALIDTSVLISPPEPGTALPDELAISVITIGELVAGVELAKSADERQARSMRLKLTRENFDPISVDEEVATEYGRLLALARQARRSQKATDLLIAATAAAKGRTLWTRDESQASLAEEAKVPFRLV